MLPLERCCHGKAEGLAWFPEGVPGAQGRERSLVGVEAGGVVREHAAGDLYWRRCAAIKAQGIVGIVNAEGRIDDWKHRLQFDAGGHTRHPVGARNRSEVSRDAAYFCPTSTGESRIQCRTAEQS